MNYARRPGIDSEALGRLAARERETFGATHAESARLAKRLGANLHVLHVLVTPPIVVLTPTESVSVIAS